MDIAAALKNCEDHLFNVKRMTVRERSLYYHIFRHTRLVGKTSGLFALQPLAAALGISESSIREDVRSLHERGCIRIEERSRAGHRLAVLLPDEIEGVLPSEDAGQHVDLEILDFFAGRRYVAVLLAREQGACFYCLRSVHPDNCELDHVVARADRTDNSYRNIVVSCHDCNTIKQAQLAEDFVRSLYRRGVLSATDLEGRLLSLELLQSGKLVTDIGLYVE